MASRGRLIRHPDRISDPIDAHVALSRYTDAE